MIVLFDGYCVLCSGFARRLKKRLDNTSKLEAMQSKEGQRLLKATDYASSTPDEVVVIENETVFAGPRAILMLLKRAGGTWAFGGKILQLFPSSFIRWGYRLIARNRYRWFGKRDSCAIV